MNKFIIQIVTQSRLWAVFNGAQIIGRFVPYQCEEEALAKATRKCRLMGDLNPAVRYVRPTVMARATQKSKAELIAIDPPAHSNGDFQRIKKSDIERWLNCPPAGGKTQQYEAMQQASPDNKNASLESAIKALKGLREYQEIGENVTEKIKAQLKGVLKSNGVPVTDENMQNLLNRVLKSEKSKGIRSYYPDPMPREIEKFYDTRLGVGYQFKITDEDIKP